MASETTSCSDVSLKEPKCMHLVLTDKDIADRQVVIVGDVHGCLDELKSLLDENDCTPSNSVLILCGDMINKGPKNCETLAYIRSLREKHVYAVRGNHEEHVLKHCLLYQQNSAYELKPKYKWIEDLTQGDIDFLQELPYTISIPSLGAIIVHAGLFPGKSLPEQKPSDMLFMRNLDFSSGMPVSSKQVLIGEPWGSFWEGPEHVYYGHDEKRRLQQYKFASCLDTGCVYGGRLTAQIISHEVKLVSVSAHQTYREPQPS